MVEDEHAQRARELITAYQQATPIVDDGPDPQQVATRGILEC